MNLFYIYILVKTIKYKLTNIIILIRVSLPLNNFRFFVVIIVISMCVASVVVAPDIFLNCNVLFLSGEINNDHILNIGTSCISYLSYDKWITIGVYIVIGAPVYVFLDYLSSKIFKTKK